MQADGSRARLLLWRVRLAHTIAWAVLASAILAIPFLVAASRLRGAAWLSLLVWGETIVFAANRLHCPLRGVAARYTTDRSDNFDIFLPVWLSRYNVRIFGSLFAVDQIALVWKWIHG